MVFLKNFKTLLHNLTLTHFIFSFESDSSKADFSGKRSILILMFTCQELADLSYGLF